MFKIFRGCDGIDVQIFLSWPQTNITIYSKEQVSDVLLNANANFHKVPDWNSLSANIKNSLDSIPKFNDLVYSFDE